MEEQEHDPTKTSVSLIRKARMASELTQPEMAKEVGTSVATIGKWEAEPDRHMTPERLRAYHDRLDDYGKRILREYVEGILPPDDKKKGRTKRTE